MPLLRIVTTRALLLRRIGLAYMLGVAAAGILAAHLALLDVPLGLLGLGLVAVASIGLGGWLFRRAAVEAPPRTRAPHSDIEWASLAVGVAATAILGILLVHAASAFAVRPLKEWDGWAIWATKAKALYEFGGVNDLVFATYEPVAHPILLPSLEAIGFRAMGAFDGTLVHVQLVALAFGFAAAVWSLLGDRVPPAVLGVGLLALLSATPVLAQLSSNLADVPLAFFFALGLVSVARFVVAGEAWTLIVAALFLSASALTKSEGLLFAASAIVAAAAVIAAAREWLRLAWIGVCAVTVLATIAPWWLYWLCTTCETPSTGSRTRSIPVSTAASASAPPSRGCGTSCCVRSGECSRCSSLSPCSPLRSPAGIAWPPLRFCGRSSRLAASLSST